MKTIVFLFFILSGSLCWAGEEAPLSFKQWKLGQLTDSQNRVVRLSNAILLLKSEKFQTTNTMPEVAEASKGETTPVKNQKNQKQIESKNKELEIALSRLEVIQELTIEDYFAVYLSHFRQQPEAIRALAKVLTADEIVLLINTVFKVKFDGNDTLPPASPAFILDVATQPLPQKL